MTRRDWRSWESAIFSFRGSARAENLLLLSSSTWILITDSECQYVWSGARELEISNNWKHIFQLFLSELMQAENHKIFMRFVEQLAASVTFKKNASNQHMSERSWAEYCTNPSQEWISRDAWMLSRFMLSCAKSFWKLTLWWMENPFTIVLRDFFSDNWRC